MASIEPPRRSRRWIYGGFALIALGVVACFGIVDGLKNCRWLDRLLGISGCVASHRVTGLQPAEQWNTLVVPVGGETLVFVGREPGNAKPVTTVLVVLDAVSGAEKLRTVVAKTSVPLGATGSATGERIALLCYSGAACFEDSSTAVIVSARDGSRLEALRRPPKDLIHMWRYPTDPDLPPWAPPGTIVLPGGELAIVGSIGTKGVEVRKITDGSLVRSLHIASGQPMRPSPFGSIAQRPAGRRARHGAIRPLRARGLRGRQRQTGGVVHDQRLAGLHGGVGGYRGPPRRCASRLFADRLLDGCDGSALRHLRRADKQAATLARG